MTDAATVHAVLRLLATIRYEVLPAPATEAKVVQHLPLDRVVTITCSPSKGLEPTLELTERLAGHGYPVVPHLAARMISGRAELAEIVDRLTGLGVTRIFVPAGDAEPVGRVPRCPCPADRPGRAGIARSTTSASPATPSPTRASTTT